DVPREEYLNLSPRSYNTFKRILNEREERKGETRGKRFKCLRLHLSSKLSSCDICNAEDDIKDQYRTMKNLLDSTAADNPEYAHVSSRFDHAKRQYAKLIAHKAKYEVQREWLTKIEKMLPDHP